MDSVFGNPAYMEQMRHAAVKGNLVAWRPRWVKEHYGNSGLGILEKVLPDEAHEVLLHPPSNCTWQELGPMMDIDRAIIETFMDGHIEQMWQYGAEIGTSDLSSLYKLLIKLAATPNKVLEKISDLFETYFKNGRMSYEQQGPNKVRLEQNEVILPRYLCSYGIPGYLESMIKLAGATKTQVEHSACQHEGAPHCVYTVSWE